MAKHRGEGGRGNVSYNPGKSRGPFNCSIILGVPAIAVAAVLVRLIRR